MITLFLKGLKQRHLRHAQNFGVELQACLGVFDSVHLHMTQTIC
jgi:hypothetical protein